MTNGVAWHRKFCRLRTNRATQALYVKHFNSDIQHMRQLEARDTNKVIRGQTKADLEAMDERKDKG